MGVALRDERPVDAQIDVPSMRVTITLSEDQATDLASGYVNGAVKSMIRELLDYAEEDQRRAARPVKKKRTKADLSRVDSL